MAYYCYPAKRICNTVEELKEMEDKITKLEQRIEKLEYISKNNIKYISEPVRCVSTIICPKHTVSNGFMSQAVKTDKE